MFSPATSLRSISREPADDAYVVLLGELATARPDVYEHSQRVCELAGAVARAFPALDMPLLDVERGALMHDIGKLAIPRSLLDKPAALTPAEHRVMQAHPVISGELLSTLPDSDNLVRLARNHHERIDGAGYPDGLYGDQLSPSSQIVAACDSWDAMTGTRPYRRALSFDDAAAELRTHAGTQWRPDVVRLLLDIASQQQQDMRESVTVH